jgi:hypothetical protein
MIALGIIADTHIPDRKRTLHPEVLPLFRDAGLDAILHAGDVSVPRVLEELGDIAPVYAVRGNRDLWRLGHLPLFLELEFGGVPILLTHGQGRWWNYLAGKAQYLIYGLQPERYKRRLVQAFPHARVIIFGHLHLPINDWVNDQLIFNPGTACCPDRNSLPPSVGFLRVHAGRIIESEIVYLKEA